VEPLGQGSAEPIGQHLEHDGRIVIVLLREARQLRFDADAGRDRKGAQVVRCRAGGRDEIRERAMRLARGQVLLLAEMHPQPLDAALPRRRKMATSSSSTELAGNSPTTARALSQRSRMIVRSMRRASA